MVNWNPCSYFALFHSHSLEGAIGLMQVRAAGSLAASVERRQPVRGEIIDYYSDRGKINITWRPLLLWSFLECSVVEIPLHNGNSLFRDCCYIVVIPWLYNCVLKLALYFSKQNKKENFNNFLKGSTFLPLIIQFSSSFNKSPTLFKQIAQSWQEFVTNNHDIKRVFEGSLPQIIFKRGTTIHSLLIKAKYSSVTSHYLNSASNPITNDTIQILAQLDTENTVVDFSVTPCKNKNCKCCKFLTSTDSFQSTTTGKIYTIPNKLNCNTSHTIYLITCQKCNKQYVGETSRKLKERLTDHRSAIETKKINCHWYSL